MLQRVLQKSISWHLKILAMSFAIYFVCTILVSSLLSYHYNKVNYDSFVNYYSQFQFLNYYPMFHNVDEEAYYALRTELSMGYVALFGSSELTSNKSNKASYEFFGQTDIQVMAFGHAGHQSLAIKTQLEAIIDRVTLENGKIVILVSPSWFSDATGMDHGLWLKEVASPLILQRILKNELVTKESKENYLKLSNYVTKLSFLDEQLLNYSDFKMSRKLSVLNKDFFQKKELTIDWNHEVVKAKEFESKLSSNELQINDEYFEKYIKPKMNENKFPFTIQKPIEFGKNPEVKDFLQLLSVLDGFQHKALFVFMPLNPKIYSNLEVLNPTMVYLQSQLHEHQFPLLNLWSAKFETGDLTDSMHLGALGWIKVNKFIYDSFVRDVK